MSDAAEDAGRYVDGMTERDFLDDQRTRRAVILCLMIIGETSAKIIAEYPSFVALHADVPWKAMRGMSNRIAHRYFDIDLAVVWKTVRFELPELVKALRDIS